MRLTLVISSVAPGGAEGVMAALANQWASDGHDVTLVTLSSAAHGDQPLHARVSRVALNLMSASRTRAEAVVSNWRRLRRLRAALRDSKPDAVVSFLCSTNVLTLSAARPLRVPVIVSERIDPREEPIPPFWAGLRRLLYPWAAAVVVQTPEVRHWATRFVPAAKVHVIPNAVRPPAAMECGPGAPPPWLDAPGNKILGMGRLTRQKGFDLLLRAFAVCHQDHPDWSLTILGEGEERGALQALVKELGIQDHVTLPGHRRDAASLLQHVQLFVLASRYEGFPNALLEAMSCGLPVIAADCPSGPRWIVRDGIDGMLVPPENVPALSGTMRRLMAEPHTRQRLGARAVEVVERFAMSDIGKRWTELVTRSVGGGGRGVQT